MSAEQAVIARERERSLPAKPRKRPRPQLPASTSDERLAKRAGRGDADAFAAIFRRYETDLYRFCVGILGEPQDAQDAIQNTMLKVMRALPGERREIQLKPWLYRIAHNEAVELRRRERVAEQLEPEIADGGSSVAERAERSERLQVLFRDMTDLPERQRAALVMRELNGLEFGEIAAALRTSPSAVRQALYEARRGLQQMDFGRQMACDSVARALSDEDGRLRGRDVRAHLRHCAECRAFRREIIDRKQALAAISPLPVLLAGGMLKSALAGSGAGGAGAGIGAAGGAAGLAGGAAAGSVAASGVLKSVAGMLAIVALGTAAADRTGIVAVDSGGSRNGAVEREAGSPNPGSAGAARIGGAAQAKRGSDLAVDAARSPQRSLAVAPDVQGMDRADQAAPGAVSLERTATSAPSPAAAAVPSPAHGEPGAVLHAPPAAPGATTTGHGHDAKSEGNSAAAAPTGDESPAQPETGPKQEPGEKSETAAKTESKAEKTEAKAEKDQANAEAKAEKGRKSEPQGVAAPSAPAPSESSPPPATNEHPAHPEHPPHPEQAPSEQAPATGPAASETEVAETPAQPAHGNGNASGKAARQEAAAAPAPEAAEASE